MRLSPSEWPRVPRPLASYPGFRTLRATYDPRGLGSWGWGYNELSQSRGLCAEIEDAIVSVKSLVTGRSAANSRAGSHQGEETPPGKGETKKWCVSMSTRWARGETGDSVLDQSCGLRLGRCGKICQVLRVPCGRSKGNAGISRSMRGGQDSASWREGGDWQHSGQDSADIVCDFLL